MKPERIERWRAEVMRAGRGFVAIHEAGHAVAAYLLHVRIDHLTIIPDADRQIAGHLKHGPTSASFKPDIDFGRATKTELERQVMLSLAGPAVDELVNSPLATSSADVVRALDLAEHAVGSDAELHTYIDRLISRMKDLLAEPPHWRAVETLADALLEEERIGRKRIRQIIGVAIDSPEDLG